MAVRVCGTVALLFMVAACGDNPEGTTDAGLVDAPRDIPFDAAVDGEVVPDADAGEPADASVDAAEVSALGFQYVIDDLELPLNPSSPNQLDIDGDGTLDGRLGLVLTTFGAITGFRIDAALDRSVARGRTLILAELSGTSASAAFRLLPGADPDPEPCLDASDSVCRRHLDGSGRFVIGDGTDPSAVVTGAVVGDRLSGGPGRLTVRMQFRTRVVDLPLIAARVVGTATAAGITAGLVGGAIPDEAVQATLIPFLAALADDQLAEDCSREPVPGCSCPAGSLGERLRSWFDELRPDCVISTDEVAQHPLIGPFLAPDLDIAPRDGRADSLSAAAAFTAVRAAW